MSKNRLKIIILYLFIISLCAFILSIITVNILNEVINNIKSALLPIFIYYFIQLLLFLPLILILKKKRKEKMIGRSIKFRLEKTSGASGISVKIPGGLMLFELRELGVKVVICELMEVPLAS